MSKELSNHAHAAKLIRTELKKHGIKGRVRARSYAGGSSVDVYLTDELPATAKKVDEFASQFQYGHFDGMQDMYVISNRNTDLPQVQFVMVQNEFSDEMRQAAWDYARATYADAAEGPEDVREAHNFRVGEMWGDMFVNRILHGHERIYGAQTFWTLNKPRQRA